MSEMNNELYHYGVKGMKWGVRKSVYKSMNRQQRRETRKKYYETPEGKVVKATKIGTLLGGPLGGVIAGSIASKKVNNIPKQKIEKGKDQVHKCINGKIETDEEAIMRLKKEGKINPKAQHIFDQDGRLFMVYYDD